MTASKTDTLTLGEALEWVEVTPGEAGDFLFGLAAALRANGHDVLADRLRARGATIANPAEHKAQREQAAPAGARGAISEAPKR